jgi:hypothetical protein
LVFIYRENSQNVKNKYNNWTVSELLDKLQNPFAVDRNTWNDTDKIYWTMCGICHGDRGKGDGIVGVTLNPSPSDLTSIGVQDKSDGLIYWEISDETIKIVNFLKMAN